MSKTRKTFCIRLYQDFNLMDINSCWYFTKKIKSIFE